MLYKCQTGVNSYDNNDIKIFLAEQYNFILLLCAKKIWLYTLDLSKVLCFNDALILNLN